MVAGSQFKHVRGPKGTFESICMTCLLAVGICGSEAELAISEKAHDCKGQPLETRWQPSRRVFAARNIAKAEGDALPTGSANRLAGCSSKDHRKTGTRS
jgi:hypothetical protein